MVTFLQPVGSRMPSSEQDVATLKAILIRAGFRSENAVPVFYGVRIITTLAMMLVVIPAAEPGCRPTR